MEEIRLRPRLYMGTSLRRQVALHEIGGPPMFAIDPAMASRRRFLRNFGIGAAAITASHFLTPGAFAEDLVRTPQQTEGPFYPDHLPLDTDNDLIVINDSITPAVGEITHLSGRILDSHGEPLRKLLVEIWQEVGYGAYIMRGKNTRYQRAKLYHIYECVV